ncbi:hypothetical protein HNQ96_000640 [Aminobacter lissarensis]|uniref:Uncharacterized protein n=2 Tax=Aminobacter carboxidus TaxID=376165 RepID=A0A8E1WAQ4_9HYPH|nr:hypothetical protein [Aminobacter lissarensis]
MGEFLGDIDWDMPARSLTPNDIKCSSLLDRTVELAPAEARPLTRILVEQRAELRWGQTYTADDFGQHFIDNYGWVELFGTRGHYANDKVAGGFLVLGPDVEYPDHHHVAEEAYLPMTGGTEWRMGDAPFGVRNAGEVIHHASNVNHAMRTGSEPLLALYLWRGGPLAAMSTVSGTVAGGKD